MHKGQFSTMPGRTDPATTARDNDSGLFYNSMIGGTVRYPNLRYGNPTEFAYYAVGVPLPDLARRLRRDERTVRDWLTGRARVPWWVPEIMRLKRLEADLRHRQMFWCVPDKKPMTRLGVVDAAGAVVDPAPLVQTA
jgi:hypothetical protein